LKAEWSNAPRFARDELVEHNKEKQMTNIVSMTKNNLDGPECEPLEVIRLIMHAKLKASEQEMRLKLKASKPEMCKEFLTAVVDDDQRLCAVITDAIEDNEISQTLLAIVRHDHKLFEKLINEVFERWYQRSVDDVTAVIIDNR
jgi:hypothetical protein